MQSGHRLCSAGKSDIVSIFNFSKLDLIDCLQNEHRHWCAGKSDTGKLDTAGKSDTGKADTAGKSNTGKANTAGKSDTGKAGTAGKSDTGKANTAGKSDTGKANVFSGKANI